MARPIKWRKVCCLPGTELFGPLGDEQEPISDITISVEEYETIRLIDLEGLTQEECAERMQVARATVQSIYKEARNKIAQAIVFGHRLRIEGGDYQLYSDSERQVSCHRCRRGRMGRCYENGSMNEGSLTNEDSNTGR
ncbi:MAG: DUF134 domain-containing protein [Clostridiaceae bacterium]